MRAACDCEYVSRRKKRQHSRDYVAYVSRFTFVHQWWLFLNPRILTLREQDVCCHICQYSSTSFVKTNGDLLSVYYPGHHVCSIFKNCVTPGWLSFDARTRTPFPGRLALQTLLHRPASWRTSWKYKVPMQNRLAGRATDAP